MQQPAQPDTARALPHSPQHHAQDQRIEDARRAVVLGRKQGRLHAHRRPGTQRLQTALHRSTEECSTKDCPAAFRGSAAQPAASSRPASR